MGSIRSALQETTRGGFGLPSLRLGMGVGVVVFCAELDLLASRAVVAMLQRKVCSPPEVE
jgi:hypothetical protein